VPRVVRVDAESPDPAVIAEAAAVLRRGGLVAFPTETVYGLGALGLHADDVAQIFEAKGRPPSHPLILHVDSEPMARRVASAWPDLAHALANAFWPGALTLVVPRADIVPDTVSGGLPTVGVRVPAHPVALALVRAVAEPLAAPSANAHTHVSPTSAAHVVRSLGDRVDLVLDAGRCRHGIESTVVDVSSGPARVLRPGALGLEALRAVIPDIGYATVVAGAGTARASPGQAARHYAPRARVVLASGAASVAAALDEARGGGARTRTGLLTWSDAARSAAGPDVHLHRALGPEPDAYARELFGALHDMEEAGCDVIVVETVPDEPAWWAVADRLRRARATE
jgi:L-threonylcarbamoyladenylate synthase